MTQNKSIDVKGQVSKGFAKTPIKIDGKNAFIIHDKLVADGPVDEKGVPLINPKTGEPYEGFNDDMAGIVWDMREQVTGFTMKALPPNNQVFQLPTYGVLTLLARKTPIFLYDHPAFKKVARTAFTDGENVFIDADFARKIHEEEKKHSDKSGIMFVILHELLHKLLLHVDRLKNFPHDIANIAEDYVINGKLTTEFRMRPVPSLVDTLVGTTDEDAKKYSGLSEETIAHQLVERKKKEKKKEGGGGGGQQQGGGQGQSGSGQDSQNGNQPGQGQGQGNGKGQPGQGQSSGGGSGEGSGGEQEDDQKNEGPSTDRHVISPEELADILKEEGLMETVGQALNVADPDDVEAVGKKQQSVMRDITDSISEARARNAECGGHMPGAHIADYAADIIGDLVTGKLTWKLGITRHILGDSLNLRPSDEEPSITWMLDAESTGIDPFYMGAPIPHASDETVLCLVDTSGSTGIGDMRKQFVQEALGLKKGYSSAGDTAKEVVLLSADTVLRGEPLIINESNYHQLLQEGVKIFGNGGTDFANCLHQALELPLLKKKRISSVIYFTDCCDAVPRKEDFQKYLDKGMKVVFVTTPGMWNEAWNRELTWAEVYCIEEGTQVNLDSSDKKVNQNTRRGKM